MRTQTIIKDGKKEQIPPGIPVLLCSFEKIRAMEIIKMSIFVIETIELFHKRVRDAEIMALSFTFGHQKPDLKNENSLWRKSAQMRATR